MDIIIILIIIFLVLLLYSPKEGIKRRWHSERRLYDEIKKVYKHSIYQYHNSSILGKQSYDIYIPSKKIAIEYQGEQHFKPVDYFGGKDSYKRQRKLDKEKKIKSKEHGITLLYFTYNKSMPNWLLGKRVYKDYNKLMRRIKYNWIYKILGL